MNLFSLYHHHINQKLIKFRCRPLQLQEELDMLFIDNMLPVREWVPISDEPMPNDGLLGEDVNYEIPIELMETFNITTVPKPTNTVDELK